MLTIGSHLSSAKGFEAMGKQAVKLGENTFAFFTRNPRGGKAKEIDPDDVEKLMTILSTQSFGKIVAHAPYTLNPCAEKEKIREFAHMAFTDDLQRMEYLPGNYYNFHPGSHVGQGVGKGIQLITELLNDCMKEDQRTMVLLETMSGKGSEIGSRFEELREILDGVTYKEHIGVCLDTCHVWSAGYDIVNDLDGVLEEFDRIIGLNRLKALHLNDSKTAFASHKDLHEKIGQGSIGMEAFARIVQNPVIKKLPLILETPNDDEGWSEEIQLLRSKSV